jgi:hypothetical protein
VLVYTAAEWASMTTRPETGFARRLREETVWVFEAGPRT